MFSTFNGRQQTDFGKDDEKAQQTAKTQLPKYIHLILTQKGLSLPRLNIKKKLPVIDFSPTRDPYYGPKGKLDDFLSRKF